MLVGDCQSMLQFSGRTEVKATLSLFLKAKILHIITAIDYTGP